LAKYALCTISGMADLPRSNKSTLIIPPYSRIIFLIPRSLRGISRWCSEDEARCGARGSGLISRALGTPWVTVRLHYGRLPLVGLDGAGRRRRKPPDKAGEESAVRVPEARSRRPKSPLKKRAHGASLCAYGAPQGVAPLTLGAPRRSPQGRRRGTVGAPRGAPLPRAMLPESEIGRRRARVANNRAGGAWLPLRSSPRKRGPSSRWIPACAGMSEEASIPEAQSLTHFTGTA
jgi:hypothetical protein